MRFGEVLKERMKELSITEETILREMQMSRDCLLWILNGDNYVLDVQDLNIFKNILKIDESSIAHMITNCSTEKVLVSSILTNV